MTTQYKVKIPLIGTVKAQSIEFLISSVMEEIDIKGYGASDVGARWTVHESGSKVGILSYNGRFTFTI